MGENSEIDNAPVPGREEKEEPFSRVVSWRRYLVFPLLICNVFGHSVSLIVMNLFVYDKIRNDQFANATFQNDSGKSLCAINTSTVAYKNQISVQQQASHWIMYFTVAHSAPGVLTNIVLGSYSDIVGRRFLFAVSLFGGIVRAVGCVLGIYFEYSLIYILPAYLIEGILGGHAAVFQSGFAYLSDTTDGKQRSLAITVMELTLGLTAMMGGFVAGYFIDSTNYFYPMIMALSLQTTSLLIATFLLPETVSVAKNRPSFSPWKYIKEVLSLFVTADSEGKRWRYNVAIVALLVYIIGMAGGGIETLYQLNAPFCWDAVQIGWFSTIRQAVQQLGGIVLIAFLARFLQDASIAAIGTLSSAGRFVVEGFAVSAVYLYIGESLSPATKVSSR